MKHFGVHQLKTWGRNSYFIERDFGNILILGDHNIDYFFNLFESRGGIAKVIYYGDELQDLTRLFIKFGPQFFPLFDHAKTNVPLYKTCDFIDRRAFFESSAGVTFLTLTQADQKITFPPKSALSYLVKSDYDEIYPIKAI